MSISQKDLVSIIIPVYNTEYSSIKRCIDSVVNQTYSNIEIIIVDDGSSVLNARSYDSLKNQYCNIVVFHINNAGASEARNYGIKHSAGAYLMFLDSDDTLKSFAVEKSLYYLKSTDADFTVGAIQKVSINDGSVIQSRLYPSKAAFQVLNITQLDYLHCHYYAINCYDLMHIGESGFINRGPIARLVKRSLALECLFPRGFPLGEDIIWNVLLLNKSKRVCIIYEVLYEYYSSSNGSLLRYRGDRIHAVTAYLLELRNCDALFWHSNSIVVEKLLLRELYRIIEYELMSSNCPLSAFEKVIAINKLFKQDPWDELSHYSLFCRIPIVDRVLFFAASTGICLPLIWLRKKIKILFSN